MLENLNSINWGELHHAFGTAEDVPDLLHELASRDAKTREDAYLDLAGNLAHQGSIYDASVAAIPFLIELLNAEKIKDKDRILFMLQVFAPYNLPDYFPSEYKAQVFLSRETVAKGLPIYLKLLDHPDPFTRAAAIRTLYMVRVYPTDQLDHILKALGKAVHTEEMFFVKDAAIYGLGVFLTTYREHFSEQLDYYKQLLQALEEELPDQVLSLKASMALVRVAREETPEATIERLIQTILNPPLDDEEELKKVQQIDAMFMGRVARLPLEAQSSLSFLGTEGYLKALSRLLKSSTDNLEARSYAVQMLNEVFPNTRYESGRQDPTRFGGIKIVFTPAKAPRRLGDLTSLQKETLWKVINHRPVWRYSTNLLEKYGLFVSRDELRKFLQRNP